MLEYSFVRASLLLLPGFLFMILDVLSGTLRGLGYTAAMRFPVRASTYFAQRDKPEQILGLGIFIHIQICTAPEHKKSALVF